MNIHWAKTKFKIEWEGSYPVKHILGDPFFVFVPFNWFFYPKFPGYLTLISSFWSFGVERSAVSYGTMLTWTLAWPVRKAFTLTQNQMNVFDTYRNPLHSCLVFHSIFNLLQKTSFWANFDSQLMLKITSVVQAERSQSCASYLNVCRRLLYILLASGALQPLDCHIRLLFQSRPPTSKYFEIPDGDLSSG